jgi:hypothetical protein
VRQELSLQGTNNLVGEIDQLISRYSRCTPAFVGPLWGKMIQNHEFKVGCPEGASAFFHQGKSLVNFCLQGGCKAFSPRSLKPAEELGTRGCVMPEAV